MAKSLKALGLLIAFLLGSVIVAQPALAQAQAQTQAAPAPAQVQAPATGTMSRATDVRSR